MSELADRLSGIEGAISRIEARLSDLETRELLRHMDDVAPLMPPRPPTWVPPWSEKPRCPACGLDMSSPMGYVCPLAYCPSQPRVICSDGTGSAADASNGL